MLQLDDWQAGSKLAKNIRLSDMASPSVACRFCQALRCSLRPFELVPLGLVQRPGLGLGCELRAKAIRRFASANVQALFVSGTLVLSHSIDFIVCSDHQADDDHSHVHLQQGPWAPRCSAQRQL